MLANRISKEFVDISLSFLRNPVTNDILLIKNEDAIKKSILNLIFTKRGERFFLPLLGSTIQDALFDLASSTTPLIIETSVKESLQNYEPRIKVNNVTSILNDSSYECLVTISYDIIGSEIIPQDLEFILKSTKA